MRLPTKLLHWVALTLTLAAPFGAYACVKWREAGRRGGQSAADPFRIAGNFYYVGASDVTSFLITSPEGHVLIDGGYPGTPPLILASIGKLGFDIRDVKIILSSEPHFDQAGGLAELQKASGAAIWASTDNADAIETGGVAGDTLMLYRLAVLSGFNKYTPARVAHRIKDGETIRLGPIEVTAHITGGHTRGCTSWSIPVREGDRPLNIVSACTLELFPGVSLVDPQNYPGIRQDLEKSIRVMRSLPVDIWVTSHARAWGRYRKYQESLKSKDPVTPFIDREGYFKFIDAGERAFRKLLAEQQGSS
jgi:metallo-beta-lactamase class B